MSMMRSAGVFVSVMILEGCGKIYLMATTLPRAPKTFGRLRHVFASAIESVQGRPNILGLEPSRLTFIVLADGLGSENLSFAAGHARNLNRLKQLEMRMASVFPTTTASALMSLTSGVMPGEHGFVGYHVYDRVLKRNQNMLTGWAQPSESLEWLTLDLAKVEQSLPVPALFLGHSNYRDSGFTKVLLPSAEYVAADTLTARFSKAIELARQGIRGVVYVYVPELDQCGHTFGPQSQRWLNLLEEFDGLVADLASSLGVGQQLLLTADHGMMQVEHDEQIHWDEFQLTEPLFVGGDTRCNFVYLEDSKDALRYREELSELLPASVFVATPGDLETAGWLSSGQQVASRMPDLFLICSASGALYHRRFASPKSLQMLGHHGGISSTELNVPGLVARG